jgi:uncharacterized protein GlcG (DUF336 family)
MPSSTLRTDLAVLVLCAGMMTVLGAGPGSRPAEADDPKPWIEQKSVRLDAALAVAQAALAHGREHGHSTAVVVANSAGDVVVALRDDGATDQFVEGATQKAWTAVNLRESTQDLDKLVRSGAQDDSFLVNVPGALFLWGGIPLKVGDAIVGAIGTAGGTGADDQAQAESGVKAFEKLLEASGG